MRANDFLSIRDFSPGQIQRFLDLARQIKAIPGAYGHALEGQTLAMIFEKPSLRTRVTFDVGIHQLGGFSLAAWQSPHVSDPTLSCGNQPWQARIGLRRREEPGAHGARHHDSHLRP